MARFEVMVALLALLIIACANDSPAAEARKPSRRLNSGSPSSPYASSTPSPDTSSPTPDISSPTPDVTSPTPDVSTPSPDISSPTPDTSTPSPLTLPPVTSTPTGGYGGYGSRSGCGTPKFWMGHPVQVPKILSLVSSLAKLFGPQVLKFIGHKTVMGAIKDTSPEAMPSLAREGAASLINAYAYKDFPLSTMDVVSRFNNALSSPELAAQQALTFQRYNEAV
eukprot:c14533_g1_i1 orf=44-712(+)